LLWNRFTERQILKSTIASTRKTEILEKHIWRKQTEKKGKKHSYVVDKAESDLTSKNVSHTTPMSRRNSSSSLPNIANKSRISAFPAPAPAPAHSAPTRLGAQNGVKSLRDSQLCYVGLVMIVLVILTCDWNGEQDSSRQQDRSITTEIGLFVMIPTVEKHAQWNYV